MLGGNDEQSGIIDTLRFESGNETGQCLISFSQSVFQNRGGSAGAIEITARLPIEQRIRGAAARASSRKKL
jgi:hypothetical protein